MEERLTRLEQHVERIHNTLRIMILQDQISAAALAESFQEANNTCDTKSRLMNNILDKLEGRITKSSSEEEEKVVLCETTDSESSSYDTLDDIPVPPQLEIEKEEANANEEENEEEESSDEEEEEDIVPMDITPLFEDNGEKIPEVPSGKRRRTPFAALRTELEAKMPGMYFRIWRRWDRILRISLTEIIPRLSFNEDIHFRHAVIRFLTTQCSTLEELIANVNEAQKNYDAIYNHMWENHPRARKHMSTVRSIFMEFQDILAEL